MTNIDKIKKEFNQRFVEPLDSELRGMNLNSEPMVMGTEKEVWAWIEKLLKEEESQLLDRLTKEIQERFWDTERHNGIRTKSDYPMEGGSRKAKISDILDLLDQERKG